MSDGELREVVTIDGKNITIKSSASPVENQGLYDDADALLRVNVFDPALKPENYSKADGAPQEKIDEIQAKIDTAEEHLDELEKAITVTSAEVDRLKNETSEAPKSREVLLFELDRISQLRGNIMDMARHFLEDSHRRIKEIMR